VSRGAGRRRIEVFDTTLRDGASAPGVSLGTPEKLRIAAALSRLGVDAIEAGFPAASIAERDSVEAVARQTEGPVVKALARARREDVDLASRAVRDAVRPRLVVYAPVSDLQIQHVLIASREEALARIRAAVAQARSAVDEVEFSPMDATRADRDFLAEAISVAAAEGATVISIPDTVGYATPGEFSALLGDLRQRLPALRSLTLAVHCHDDLGLALANSLAGVEAGATAVECSINGLGARAGNAALEEFVALVDARGDDLGVCTGVDPSGLVGASRLVSDLSGCAVAPNKAIVGSNAFEHHPAAEAAVARLGSTYQVVDPTRVGLTARDRRGSGGP
jgi:2-isopropylmalate synthase